MKTYPIPPECLERPSWGIDPRHAQVLFNLLLHPTIKYYLEIGAGYGLSTSAAMAAHFARQAREWLTVHVCETEPKAHVVRLLYPHALLHPMRGVDYLRRMTRGICGDAVFIDGDHSPENVALEIAELKRLDVPTIIAHDTAFDRFPGPQQFLTAYADWPNVHDTRWRGLFVASKYQQVVDLAAELIVEAGSLPEPETAAV